MKLRDVAAKMNIMTGPQGLATQARKLFLDAASQARERVMPEHIRASIKAAEAEENEFASWLEPEDITPAGGKFDVCDLRVWLKLAKGAGVAYVPAQQLLSVSSQELAPVLETILLPSHLAQSLEDAVDSAIASDPELAKMLTDRQELQGPDQDRTAAIQKAMSDVLDGIPQSWMVRTHLGGPSNLKALVGSGMTPKRNDTEEMPDGERPGAGWSQIGSRRIINFRDSRFTELGGEGHKQVTHYLARPWETAARTHDDSHTTRGGSPLSGPGKWPAEWRVFVRNGMVTGVANYYAWTGEGATPQNAWNAIEAAALAQKVIDHMASMKLQGEFMRTLVVRSRKEPDASEKIFGKWERDGIHASLDFIETEEGLKFLEGGPAHMPSGGGHPCAFAGQHVDRTDMSRSVASCSGVAFLPMPHVDLADRLTWIDGDPAGNIVDFDVAARLAREHDALTPAAEEFLLRIGTEPDFRIAPL